MRFTGFVGPSYLKDSPNIDAQRCINLYPERNESGTSKEAEPYSLIATPGYVERADLNNGVGRGLFRASNGTVYGVSGNKLYKVSSAWVVTEIGTLSSNTGNVSMADNGSTLVVVDGVSGYTADLSTDAFASITDPDFVASDQVTYQDGYFIFNEQATGRFFYSDEDAATIDSNQFTADAFPDNLVGLISDHRDLWLFGEDTTEVYYNAGENNAIFQRVEGAFIEFGCESRWSIAKMNNDVFWLGKNQQGNNVIYKARGYQPQRISTHAVETAIAGYTSTNDAVAFTYQQGGHYFYCINFTGAETTWVYDDSTGLWHERAYFSNGDFSRHRANYHVFAYDANLILDYENGKIYEFSLSTYTDNGDEIRRMRTAPHLSSGLKNIMYHSFQLDIEVGVGLDGAATVQGHDPLIALQWSDDGGHSWSFEKWQELGKIGARKTRVIWRRLGYSRDRVFRVLVTDPNKIAIIGAELMTSGGTS